jgi:hypothetical protein
VFRFDGASGAISDRRTLVHIDQPGVVPDGLTVDEEAGSGSRCGTAGDLLTAAEAGPLTQSQHALPGERAAV